MSVKGVACYGGGGGSGEELVYYPAFRSEQKLFRRNDSLLQKPGNSTSGFTRTKFLTPLKVLSIISWRPPLDSSNFVPGGNEQVQKAGFFRSCRKIGVCGMPSGGYEVCGSYNDWAPERWAGVIKKLANFRSRVLAFLVLRQFFTANGMWPIDRSRWD